MNKDQFLKTLETSLISFTEEERKEILYDYEEHFRIGLQNSKTEEELIEELGSPDDIAMQYRGNTESENIDKNSDYENSIQPPKHLNNTNEERGIATSIIAAIALGFFNLVFIIWIFVAVGATLFGLAAASIAITFAGIVAVFAPIAMPFFPNLISVPTNIPYELTILFGIGTTALGALFCIGMFYLVKYFCIVTVKYIKWNISIIKR